VSSGEEILALQDDAFAFNNIAMYANGMVCIKVSLGEDLYEYEKAIARQRRSLTQRTFAA